MKTRHWDRLGNGGLTFTNLSMGTAPLGNLYQAISDADAESTLEAAWQAGVRHFDTAPLYGAGTAERRLGRFLFQKDRADWTMSSKVGRLLKVCEPSQRLGIGKFFAIPSRAEVFDYSFDGVMRSVELSLERLGLDRLDVLYAHDLDVFTHGSVALRDHYLQQVPGRGLPRLSGLARAGCDPRLRGGGQRDRGLRMAGAAGRRRPLPAGRPATPLLEQNALDGLLPLCEQRGIGLVLGGVFNSGILATGAKPGANYNYSPRARAGAGACAPHRAGLRRAPCAPDRGGTAIPAGTPGDRDPC